MSIHGVCFDNGQSGKCDVECEQFLDGGCDAAGDVFENCLEGMHEEYEEEIYEIYPDLRGIKPKKEIEMSEKQDAMNMQHEDRVAAANKLHGLVGSLTKVERPKDTVFFDGNEKEVFCETVNVPVKVVCLENNGMRRVIVNATPADPSVLKILVSAPLIKALVALEKEISDIDTGLGCENLDKMVEKALSGEEIQGREDNDSPSKAESYASKVSALEDKPTTEVATNPRGRNRKTFD